MNDELIPYDDYNSISGALDIFIRLVNAFSVVSREIERRRTVSANDMQRLKDYIIAAKRFRMLGYAIEMQQYNLSHIQKFYEQLENCDGYYREDLIDSIRRFSRLLDNEVIEMMNEMKGKRR